MMAAHLCVMAHLVAGYPSDSMAIAVADSLVSGGVSYLEVQLPFSDPSADGVAIQKASSEVLARGYTMRDNLRFVEYLAGTYPTVPVYVMTYGNLAYHRGIETFVGEMARAGAKGLIIPDLPFDQDEGLAETCRIHHMHTVPVAAPSMTEIRKRQLLQLERTYVYAALRAGITGSETIIDSQTTAFLDTIRGNSLILGGFGIRNGEQAKALSPHVHAVVAGSVFVDLIAKNSHEGVQRIQQVIQEKAEELTGSR